MKPHLSVLLILISALAVFAQNPKKLATAGERSEKASAVLSQLAGLGKDSVPFEYLQKAKAVAVVPGIVKVNLLLSELTIGRGLVSLRTVDGWSAPAFLTLTGTGYDFAIVKKKSFDVVILIMNDEALSEMKKGGVSLDHRQKALLGPVVKADAANAALSEAAVVYYTLDDGKLVGDYLASNFFKGFFVLHDDRMNRAIYRMKGRALLDKPENKTQPPAGVEKFTQKLNEFLPPAAPQSEKTGSRRFAPPVNRMKLIK